MQNDNSYSWSKYADEIIYAVMPWIAFACLALLVLVMASLIRCLKCMCCKGKSKDRGNGIKNLFVAISFLVTLLALACCAFIIFYSDAAYQSYQQLQCAAGRIPYGLLDGNDNYQWMGLRPASLKVNDVKTFMDSQYSSLTLDLWENTEWLSSAQPDFDKAINIYYENFTDATVPSPNPEAPNEIITSFTSNMGPLNQQTTFAGSINAEYYYKISPILTIMTELFAASMYSADNIENIVNELDLASSNLNTFISGSDKVNNRVDDWIVNNQSTVKDSWRGFSLGMVVWGWFICIGVLLTVSAQALNKPMLAHGLCCFWFFIGFISLLGFMLSATVLAVGLVTDNTCGLLDDLFTESGLAKYNMIIPSDIVPYLQICLNGDGDLYEVLNIIQPLTYITNLTELDTELGHYDISHSLGNFLSFQYNQANITWSRNYSNALEKNTNVEDTADYNLALLNNYTNNFTIDSTQATCTPNFSSDQWVFNKNDCDISYNYIDSTVPTSQLGEKTCLVILEWSSEQVKSRYEPYLTCTYFNALGNYTEIINAYHSSLGSFQSAWDILYLKIQYALNGIEALIENTVGKLIAQNGKINNYFDSETQIAPLVSDISGPDGLLTKLNCIFIHEYSKTLKKTMCTNSMEAMYQMFIYIFILSFLMLVLELVNLYLSVALLKREENN